MYGCKKRISKLVNNALSQNFIVLLRIINSSLTNIRQTMKSFVELRNEMMTAGDAGIPQDTSNMKPKKKQKPLTRHYVEIMGKRKKQIK